MAGTGRDETAGGLLERAGRAERRADMLRRVLVAGTAEPAVAAGTVAEVT
jgi:hypothetical protein